MELILEKRGEEKETILPPLFSSYLSLALDSLALENLDCILKSTDSITVAKSLFFCSIAATTEGRVCRFESRNVIFGIA